MNNKTKIPDNIELIKVDKFSFKELGCEILSFLDITITLAILGFLIVMAI